MTTKNGHTYAEAFMLMTYQCEKCGAKEIVWNSRDGVTPFMGPECRAFNDSRERQCGGATQHVDWQNDVYKPDYRPIIGDRIWRDGTLDMMRAIKKKMVNSNSQYITKEMEAEGISAFIERIAVEEHGEGGWPALVDAHSGSVYGL